jgi:hypothetical protein
MLQAQIQILAYSLCDCASTGSLPKNKQEDFGPLFIGAARFLCNPVVKQLLVGYDRNLSEVPPDELLLPPTDKETGQVIADIIEMVRLRYFTITISPQGLNAYAKTTVYPVIFQVRVTACFVQALWFQAEIWPDLTPL